MNHLAMLGLVPWLDLLLVAFTLSRARGVTGEWNVGDSSCAADLQALMTCDNHISLQVACSDPQVLGMAKEQQLLGCSSSEDLAACQQRCLDYLGELGLPINSTSPDCTLDQQRLLKYSGSNRDAYGLVFAVTDETGVRKPHPVPFLRAEDFMVPYKTYLGDEQRCLQEEGTQYCILNARSTFLGLQMVTLFGLCRPASCSQSSISANSKYLAAQVAADDFDVGCRRSDARAPPVEWTIGRVAALVFFVQLMLLLLVSTVLEKYKAARSASSVPGGPEHGQRGRSHPSAELLGAWSLQRNVASFWRTREEKSGLMLGVIDGLRVLSTLWVILGHTVIWPILSIVYENSGTLFPPKGRLTELWFQIVPGGYFAVDTFFWLSGFLGARGLHAKVRRSPRLLTPKGFFLGLYPLSIFARWLRLTPVYAFVILFSQTWFNELGKGGLLWSLGPLGMGCTHSIDNDTCKNWWWTNLLYINNLVPNIRLPTPSCMLHTWYLACDMQMFLILPFLVLIRERLGAHVGWTVLAVLFVVTTVANAVVISKAGLVADPVLGTLAGDFLRLIYQMSWMRAQPYLLGVGASWMLDYLEAGAKKAAASPGGQVEALEMGGPQQWLSQSPGTAGAASPAVGTWLPDGGALGGTLLGPPSPRRRAVWPFVAVLLQVLSFAAMCFVVFMPVTLYRCKALFDCILMEKSPWPLAAHVVYGALNHAIWGLGIGCLLMLCFLRAPGTGWLIMLLGNRGWQVPQKLTYGAYLVHPVVMVFLYCQSDAPLHYLDITTLCYFVTFGILSFAVAFLLWLAVEKPLANMTAWLLGTLTGSSGSGDA